MANIYNPDLTFVPGPRNRYYPRIGRIEFIKEFEVDGHKVVQARIERLPNGFWPRCFTWVDEIPWPYRESTIKGHHTFPKIDRIRKLISNREFAMNRVEKHTVLIHVREHDAECEFSDNTPCLLADKIKEVVKEFYKK